MIALKGTLGTAVSGIVTLLDYTDPLTCTIDSTAGSIFKNGSGTTTLTCRVFQSGAGSVAKFKNQIQGL